MIKNILYTGLLISGLLISSCSQNQDLKKFNYKSDLLSIDETGVSDSLRRLTIDSLSARQPAIQTKLKNATPFTQKLWQVALSDVESNIVETPNGRYFGAGKEFGVMIYTRDICYSGILGVSQFYPELVLSSLKVTRDVRLKLGFKVPENYIIPELNVNWEKEDLTEGEFMKKYHTNNYIRRTDDVVWLWAAADLFERHPEMADWDWVHEAGNNCFNLLYNPFFDEGDGLFRGQSSFIDIHYDNNAKATGYPQDWKITDCVMIKALSTNCLYYKGLLTMATCCEKTGKTDEAKIWTERAENLKSSIVKNLSFGDGTFSYFKHTDGHLESRREALGTALAVLSGIVEGEAAKKCMANYEVTWSGVPLLKPFYPWKGFYHNNTSWPYVDTFFLWAKEKTEQKDYTSLNAALLARTCVKTGSFHEVVNWTTKEPYGSGSQLWSAAGFINVCLRAGLVEY